MVTAFVARYDPATGLMSWSRAGHPPPLLVAPDGDTRFLDDVNGAPLGTMAREYRTATTRLDPGALIVCYTDGLVERRDRILDDGLAWLDERVREYTGATALATLCDKLVDDPFVPHPSPDDICVVALRVDRDASVTDVTDGPRRRHRRHQARGRDRRPPTAGSSIGAMVADTRARRRRRRAVRHADRRDRRPRRAPRRTSARSASAAAAR